MTKASRFVPWYAKIGLKLVLSRLPLDYSVWRRLSVFKLGKMVDPAYAYRVWRDHVSRAHFGERPVGFQVLELGPGDSISSGIVAHACGASRSYLVDRGDFATSDLACYKAMSQFLRAQGLPCADLSGAKTRDEVCRLTGITYLTGGVSSLRSIPDGSIDLQFSQVVLAMVRRSDFMPLLHELRRILRVGGVSSHMIDLKDHLGGALNNLRFSEKIWEAEWMAKSGFYTNRIRFAEMLEMFRDAGFSAEVASIKRWPSLPTPRHALDQAFRSLPDEDLLVSDAGVVLRPT